MYLCVCARMREWKLSAENCTHEMLTEVSGFAWITKVVKKKKTELKVQKIMQQS